MKAHGRLWLWNQSRGYRSQVLRCCSYRHLCILPSNQPPTVPLPWRWQSSDTQLRARLGSFLSPGSTSTRNSSQKGSSVVSVKQKSRRELYMEKLQEHLIKAKAFTIKK